MATRKYSIKMLNELANTIEDDLVKASLINLTDHFVEKRLLQFIESTDYMHSGEARSAGGSSGMNDIYYPTAEDLETLDRLLEQMCSS